MTDEAYAYIEERLAAALENTSIAGAGLTDRNVNRLTESNIVRAFCRYVYDGVKSPLFLMDRTERLFAFNGRHYEPAIYENLGIIVEHVMERLGIQGIYQTYSAPLVTKRCWSGLMATNACRFVPDRRFVAFSNGILDLKKRRLEPFGEKRRTDIILDFPYMPGHSNALWSGKLAEIIPDPDMRNALQMFFGCLLLDRDEIKVEYICFLLGSGGNGKSVLVDAVINTFGGGLFSRFSPEQLFKSQQSMYHLAALEGKLANFCDDVSNKDFSGGDFKSFVSGAEFEARRPYGHNTFMVRAPFFICCANEMPPTTDDSDGFHRRILVITTCNRMWSGAEKDPRLGSKLKALEVRQAIFNWVLEGYYKVVECDGNIPLGESVIETQKVIREDSNSARRWIRDAGLVPAEPEKGYDGRWKKLTDLYAQYRDYCMENGERTPQKSSSLSKLFRTAGFKGERRSTGWWFCVGKETGDAGGAKSTAAKRSEYWEKEREEEREMLENLPF